MTAAKKRYRLFALNGWGEYDCSFSSRSEAESAAWALIIRGYDVYLIDRQRGKLIQNGR